MASLVDARATRFWPSPPHQSERETLDMIMALVDGPERAWAVRARAGGGAVGLVYFLGDAQSGMIGRGYMPRFGTAM